MTRIPTHLITTKEPVAKGQSCTVACGVEIEKADWSYVFDTFMFSDWRSQIAQMQGICWRCKKRTLMHDNPTGTTYLTAIRGVHGNRTHEGRADDSQGE